MGDVDVVSLRRLMNHHLLLHHTPDHSHSAMSLVDFVWLVGPGPPLWNIWKSIGMMTFPIYGKIKHVPNHQAVVVTLSCILGPCAPSAPAPRSGKSLCPADVTCGTWKIWGLRVPPGQDIFMWRGHPNLESMHWLLWLLGGELPTNRLGGWTNPGYKWDKWGQCPFISGVNSPTYDPWDESPSRGMKGWKSPVNPCVDHGDNRGPAAMRSPCQVPGTIWNNPVVSLNAETTGKKLVVAASQSGGSRELWHIWTNPKREQARRRDFDTKSSCQSDSWFVVEPPLWKYEFVNWDDDIPNMCKNKKWSKPPTSDVSWFQ